MSGYPHRRFDPLRREWIVVSPHRLVRPWQGEVAQPSSDPVPQYDPNCYLCPGTVRANGERNPDYKSVFGFVNDYSALSPDPAPSPQPPGSSPLFFEQHERGVCRVLCFSPRHDLRMSQMDVAAIVTVIDAWIAEGEALTALPWVEYVTVFENRGAMMGASNPHPHGQIWGTEHVPDVPVRERMSLAEYQSQHGACLLCDYLEREIVLNERVVCANDAFVVVVPFWAMWPFETLLVSRRHAAALRDLDASERAALADILQRLTSQYDGLFQSSCPYSMGFHQELRDGHRRHAHLHAHFYPPLLRSATIRKYMVGFEMLGTPQRDFTPEEAARRLTEASSGTQRPR